MAGRSGRRPGRGRHDRANAGWPGAVPPPDAVSAYRRKLPLAGGSGAGSQLGGGAVQVGKEPNSRGYPSRGPGVDRVVENTGANQSTPGFRGVAWPGAAAQEAARTGDT